MSGLLVQATRFLALTDASVHPLRQPSRTTLAFQPGHSSVRIRVTPSGCRLAVLVAATSASGFGRITYLFILALRSSMASATRPSFFARFSSRRSLSETLCTPPPHAWYCELNMSAHPLRLTDPIKGYSLSPELVLHATLLWPIALEQSPLAAVLSIELLHARLEHELALALRSDAALRLVGVASNLRLLR